MMAHTMQGQQQSTAVLFLHGFMGSMADWTPLVARLQHRYRCLCVDVSGHGQSLSMDAACYTMDGAARSLIDLLDHHDIERCVVVGYSMGGRLALYFALHYPDHCRALVIESASPGLADAAEREARRAVDDDHARRLEQGNMSSFLNDWYQQPLFASLSRHEGLADRMIAMRSQNDPRELARVLWGMGTGTQPSLWKRLAACPCPTLVLVGALDAKYVGVARRMASVCPRMRVAVVPEAGHNVHTEAPDAYLKTLLTFLNTST